MKGRTTSHETNFIVPAGFKHVWIFVAGPMRAVIECEPGRNQIHHHQFQIEDELPPDLNQALVLSRSLDWMEETNSHLRFLCEPEKE